MCVGVGVWGAQHSKFYGSFFLSWSETFNHINKILFKYIQSGSLVIPLIHHMVKRLLFFCIQFCDCQCQWPFFLFFWLLNLSIDHSLMDQFSSSFPPPTYSIRPLSILLSNTEVSRFHFDDKKKIFCLFFIN